MRFNLIAELKAEHRYMLDHVQQIQSLGIDSTEGSLLLNQIKDTLLKHLEKEDRELYPLLNQKAKADQSLKGLLQRMYEEMIEISTFVTSFFTKYTENPTHPDLRSEFSQLDQQLTKRIRMEEITLYEQFNRLSAR